MADLRGGDLSRLRQLNSLTAIKALRGAGPLTLSALAERTGLSRPSMKEVADELVELGWVEEVRPSPGTMGRPARRYRFRADSGHLVGVDIGAHNVRAALSDLDGEILAETRQPVLPGAPLDERLAALERAISGCLALSRTTVDDLWTISVGTSGVIDVEGRVIYSAAVPAWRDLDLAGRVREMFPCEVLIENDSRLAALAESRRGTAKGVRDMVFLHVGRRMGAAAVIGGTVHRGFGAASGEIVMLPESRWFDAPEHLNGCAVVPEGTPPEDAAGYTLAAARNGDPVALEAVGRYVDDLAVGTAAMVLILDPEVVVLGGGFSRSADVLLPPLRERLERRCMRMPEVRASTLGDECVVVGAIDYAVEHLDRQLFAPDAGPLPLTR
ncbi:ROK family transcriptional regulator [Nonomuraea pusilla]|uniref:Sugar kinase of the NBD/HSP70 family, may contain an N-terminal HTH domain n=1 Tax=Nonomuraea pusilla TaxID=46177 RepID=A0A1H7KHY5_9ACTN|nr:ROK family transcriptional regulator [Nonomuraea pusilla]SEK86503.1 Sugar kinase of the NBD/HSP70 family, may contain an N-terminal HTH domain [Nonomuraea pusilla]